MRSLILIFSFIFVFSCNSFFLYKGSDLHPRHYKFYVSGRSYKAFLFPRISKGSKSIVIYPSFFKDINAYRNFILFWNYYGYNIWFLTFSFSDPKRDLRFSSSFLDFLKRNVSRETLYFISYGAGGLLLYKTLYDYRRDSFLRFGGVVFIAVPFFSDKFMQNVWKNRLSIEQVKYLKSFYPVSFFRLKNVVFIAEPLNCIYPPESELDLFYFVKKPKYFFVAGKDSFMPDCKYMETIINYNKCKEVLFFLREWFEK